MRKFCWMALISILAVEFALSQAPPPSVDPGAVATFRSFSSLVLLDVVAQDPKTGLPISTLMRGDFQVLDNKVPVPITTFESAEQGGTRAVSLWFVVSCSEQPNVDRSGLFGGREWLFRAALEKLELRDTVGVAHWCDNGDFELDQTPTTDRDLAVRKLGEALQPIPFIAPENTRVGELAAQEMFRAIIRDAHKRNPKPLPVLLMLHGDLTGMPSRELDAIIDDFLETSGIVFGIADASVPTMYPLNNGEQAAIFHYMAKETSGQYFSVAQDRYGATLVEIITRLHHRYELGFKPPAIDGKRHKLEVRLTDKAREKYKGARIHSRHEYIPSAGPEFLQIGQ